MSMMSRFEISGKFADFALGITVAWWFSVAVICVLGGEPGVQADFVGT
jgi:hypothetical protein